jgi:hypothetical protein
MVSKIAAVSINSPVRALQHAMMGSEQGAKKRNASYPYYAVSYTNASVQYHCRHMPYRVTLPMVSDVLAIDVSTRYNTSRSRLRHLAHVLMLTSDDHALTTMGLAATPYSSSHDPRIDDHARRVYMRFLNAHDSCRHVFFPCSRLKLLRSGHS